MKNLISLVLFVVIMAGETPVIITDDQGFMNYMNSICQEHQGYDDVTIDMSEFGQLEINCHCTDGEIINLNRRE